MILPAVGTCLPDNTPKHIKDSNLSTHLRENLQFHTFHLTNDKGSDKIGKHGYIWEQNISVKLQETMYDGTEWMVEDKKQG